VRKIDESLAKLHPDVQRFFEMQVQAYFDVLEQVSKDVDHVDVFDIELLEIITKAELPVIEEAKRLEGRLGEDSDEIKAAKLEFRKRVAPWYSQSYFMHRAMTKPEGYHGDHRTLEDIYNNQSRSKGFGQVLDRRYLDSTLARAVRGRKDRMIELLRSLTAGVSDVRIFNIAAGGGRELVELLPTIETDGLTITCYDFDPNALRYSAEQLGMVKRDAVLHFIRGNVLRMPRAVQREVESAAQQHGQAQGDRKYIGQDIVYSIGLYDYLPDIKLKEIFAAQNLMLNEFGRMVIAFKDCTRYDKTSYDWGFDWRFVQRNEADIDKLLGDIGVPLDRVTKTREKTGTVIFYEIPRFGVE